MEFKITSTLLSKRKSVLTFIMRTFILLFCTAVFSLSSGDILSQNSKILIDSDKTVTIEEIFDIIDQQTDYSFVYRSDLFKDLPKIQIKKGAIQANELLKNSMALSDFNFSFGTNNTISITAKSEAEKLQQQVTGKVTDEFGNPILGANVIIQNTQTGVSTDFDGNYSIQAKQGDILIFSYVGFLRQAITVESDSSVIDVVLKIDQNVLEEIIITGYQRIPKERSAGSFAKADISVVGNRSTSMNILQRLDGLVPGLLLNNAPTTEDADSSILIRGLSSINANRQPLFVVDGVPLSDVSRINPQDVSDVTVLKDATATSIYGSRATNGVIVITTKRGTPSQKIEINYDHFTSFQGRPDLDYLPVLNSEQFIQFAQDIFDPVANPYFNVSTYQSGSSAAVKPHELILYDLDNGLIDQATANAQLGALASFSNANQIEDLFYREGMLSNHTLSLSGGGEKHNFYASVAYTNTRNNRPGDSDDTYKLNVNQDFKFTDKIKFNVITDLTRQSVSGRRALNVTPNTLPYVRFRDDQGNNLDTSFYQFISRDQFDFFENGTGVDLNYNVLDEINTRSTQGRDFQARINISPEIDLHKNLKFQGLYSYVYGDGNVTRFDTENSFNVRHENARFVQPGANPGELTYLLPQSGGHFYTEDRLQQDWIIRNQLNYTKSWNNGLNQFSLLAGQEVQEQLSKFSSAFQRGYDPRLQTFNAIDNLTLQNGVTGVVYNSTFGGSRLNNFNEFSPLRQNEVKSRISSYYGNTSFTYDAKYTITGSLRFDESNLFGADKSAQNRPVWSVGGKWLLSNESFLENSTWLDMLALRTTYGITGNAPTPGTAASFDLLEPTFFGFLFGGRGLAITAPGNPNLTWERTQTVNFGLDFSLANNRITGSIDYYQKQTEDLIGDLQVNPLTGFNTITGNFGDLENKGVELQLTTFNIATDDFTWFTNINFAYNKNTITELNNTTPIITGADQIRQRYVVGQPAFAVYAYDFVGLDDLGDPQIRLADGTVTKAPNVDSAEDTKFMGSYLPEITGGLSNTFRYKNFSLTANMVYSFGAVMRRDTPNEFGGFIGGRSFIVPGRLDFGNQHIDVINRWQQPGDENITNIPAHVSNQAVNDSRRDIDYYIQGDINVVDADYVKLRDITLSYRLPKKAVNKIGLDDISLRAQVSNLMLWRANDDNIDPEFHDGFIGSRSIPNQQGAVTFGINLSL